jgi:hypothetical protein
MSAGNFRLRRPDQINSASESAKPWIMADYNVMRYDFTIPGYVWIAGHLPILKLK